MDGQITTQKGISEDKLMAACHQYLWNEYPESRYLCWHIPNERKQSAAQGAIMKAKGVLSGAPDYVINWNQKTYWIEFKTQTGKQSDNQKKVEIALKNQNIDYYIIRSFEEFKLLLESILRLKTSSYNNSNLKVDKR
jgi:hypothetical protein